MHRQDITRSCAAIVLALATIASAETALRLYESAAPHAGEVQSEGGSNVKDWEVRGNVIRGRIQLSPPAGGETDGIPSQAEGDVRIPVQSLTGGSRAMDRRMFEALDADRVPEIRFTLTSLENNDADNAEDYPLLAHGALRIRDRRRTVRAPIRLDANESGLRLFGVKKIRMSDYGIDPPRALLGALRTHDTVIVRFEWILDEAPP